MFVELDHVQRNLTDNVFQIQSIGIIPWEEFWFVSLWVWQIEGFGFVLSLNYPKLLLNST